MSKSDKKISIIDLIEYYEPGPVLKQRTPDLNRTSFHPGDGEYFEGDDHPEPGKSITSSINPIAISKKAVGLISIPNPGVPGNNEAFSPRHKYDEADTQFFGGPSLMGNFPLEEDKSPTNISRKEENSVKDNLESLGDLEEMSFDKKELLTLAKALRSNNSGKYADFVLKLAATTITQGEKALFEKVWSDNDASDATKEAAADPSSAFVRSLYGLFGFAMGTKEGLMLAALLHGPDQKKITDALSESWQSQSTSTVADAGKYILGLIGGKIGKGVGASAGSVGGAPGAVAGGAAGAGTGYYIGSSIGEWLGNKLTGGKSYEESTIPEMVSAELSGDELTAAMLILQGKVTLANFDPVTGKFKTGTGKSSGGGTGAGTGARTAPSSGGAKTGSWRDVQNKINELYGPGGCLDDKADDIIGGALDSKGNPIRIPLSIDDQPGPQTTGAYNAATGSSVSDYSWGITPAEALIALDNVCEKEAVSEPDNDSGEGARQGEPGEGAVISGDDRVKYMTMEEFNADYWTAQSPQYKDQIVGVGKRGTSVEGNIVFMDDRFPEATYNKKKLVRPSDSHALVMPIEAREGNNFPGQPQTLTVREKRRLLSEIRPNVDREELVAFRKILGGSIQEGRTGGFTSRRSRARGQRRQDAGRRSLK